MLFLRRRVFPFPRRRLIGFRVCGREWGVTMMGGRE